MNTEEPSYGPLQMVLVGFETTEHFRGEIARELLELRGRGMIRVIDARFLYRARDGKMTEVDLGPLLADRPHEDANPIARLLGVNGFGGNGSSESAPTPRTRSSWPTPPAAPRCSRHWPSCPAASALRPSRPRGPRPR